MNSSFCPRLNVKKLPGHQGLFHQLFPAQEWDVRLFWWVSN
jgi:hypothetical protein